ncbi:MAG: glycosyltransferase family A protein [Cyanobacteria bacterium P01_E01_bin.35]
MDRTQPVRETPLKHQYTFTVFTATYNRAHTLSRVFESLQKQDNYHDFEWLIVDDGSTDNTGDLVKQWQQKSMFPIRYFYQENRGKHTAFNRGVREAKGELFLNFDSDDSCVPQALSRFKFHWNAIPEAQRQDFTGVTCLCMDEQEKIVGSRFPFDPTDSDCLEIFYKYKVRGDKWGFHRREVLLKYPFPEITDHHGRRITHIPENIVWKSISRKYKTRFVNEPLRTYFSGSDQITKSPLGKNAFGCALENNTILNTDLDYFWFAPKKFLYSAIHYSRFSFHIGRSLKEQIEKLNTIGARILWLFGLPIGYLVYLKDRTR